MLILLCTLFLYKYAVLILLGTLFFYYYSYKSRLCAIQLLRAHHSRYSVLIQVYSVLTILGTMFILRTHLILRAQSNGETGHVRPFVMRGHLC